MISEGSCDTEDWNNAITVINSILKYTNHELKHMNNISQCYYSVW